MSKCRNRMRKPVSQATVKNMYDVGEQVQLYQINLKEVPTFLSSKIKLT